MFGLGQAGGELLLFAFVFVFLGIWIALTWVISRLGGWHTLAQAYPWETTTFGITTEQAAKRFRWSSMTMGPSAFPTNYGGCVNVTVCDEGLGLSTALLFRAFHAPIFIPWTAVETCEQSRLLWMFQRTEVALQDRPHPLYFSGKCAAGIAQAWANRSVK